MKINEEFAVFQQASGGGYNVSKFVDVEGQDTEARAKGYAAEFGGEVKRRQVTTVYGPWVPVDTEEDSQPGAPTYETSKPTS